MKRKEDEELIKFFECVAWYKKTIPELDAVFHVANERKASIQTHIRLKKKGVKSGIPDVLVLIPNDNYHGLMIEFKSQKGKVSESQEKMLKLFHALGYCVRIAYSADDAIIILKTYLLRFFVNSNLTFIKI